MTTIKSYEDANAACYKRGKPSDSRKIGNNTYVERRGEDIAVKLHNTDVVTYRPDGSITLDSGGWRTVTTKARMNEFSPLSVGSVRGVWQVSPRYDWDNAALFHDGITAFPDGGGRFTLTVDPDAERRVREARDMQRRITNFTKRFRVEIDGNGTVDTTGDCFLCLLGQQDGHLLQHIEEDYYVPTMFANACKARGYPIPFALIERDSGKLDSMGRRVLRRYLSGALVRELATA